MATTPGAGVGLEEGGLLALVFGFVADLGLEWIAGTGRAWTSRSAMVSPSTEQIVCLGDALRTSGGERRRRVTS